MFTTLQDEKSVALEECSKALISGRFGLILVNEDDNRMDALRRWPNSRCSVLVESRSISGLSPYNDRKTAERRLRVNRASNSSGIRHQARGYSQDRTSVHFISEASHATVAFCPWNPSALYYFCLSGSQLYFSTFYRSSLPCSRPGFQGFRPTCMHYGMMERDGSMIRLLGIRMAFLLR
jgi:hypothetical protein